MLMIAKNLGSFSFGKLMEVYLEANRKNGEKLAPEQTEERQIQLSEQYFYTYLRDCFFSQPCARYYIWEEDGNYVSALRLEPYLDGLLLEALETAPSRRRMGYAVRLIQAVQEILEQQGSVRLYSHVSKRNEASLKAHRACGFEVVLDHAAYIDGSVNNRAYTLRYEKNSSKNKKKN